MNDLMVGLGVILFFYIALFIGWVIANYQSDKLRIRLLEKALKQFIEENEKLSLEAKAKREASKNERD